MDKNKFTTLILEDEKLEDIKIRSAICVPDSCSERELEKYFSIVLGKYNITISFTKEDCSIKYKPKYKTLDYVVM